MTGTPIQTPHSSGLEIVVFKDGNPWNICDAATLGCDGEAGSLAANGQVVGIPSKEPYFYTDVTIPHGERLPLVGYHVGVRYYEQFQIATPQPPDPITGLPVPDVITYTRDYPGFELVSQTYERTGRRVFDTDTGEELFGAQPSTIGADQFATAGISDGTAYVYGLVFDQADIRYMPRLSRIGQDLAELLIPTFPYDPGANPPVYPIDYIVSFLPDPRDSVTVSYRLTTQWTPTPGGAPFTTTVIINHTCNQPPFDFLATFNKYRELSYFGNGYEHIGLYPPPGYGADLPEYDRFGKLQSGILNEPVNIKQLTRRTYPWDKNTQQFKEYPE